MNAGGGLISSQTTSSMIVEYGKVNIIWFTMSPSPEISLFKPTFFTDENNPLNIKNEQELIKIWKLNNLFFRKFIQNYEENFKKIKNLKEENQKKIFELFDREELENLLNHQLNEITIKSLEIENEYRDEGLKIMEKVPMKNYFYFTSYWKKENKKFINEEKDEQIKKLYLTLLS